MGPPTTYVALPQRNLICLTALPALFTPLFSLPVGFSIYFGYGLWHSEEASLAAGQARTPDNNLDRCK